MINSFLQKLSTWVSAKLNISTRIDFLLLTNVTLLRAITMCSALTPVCGYDNSTINLIGDVYCPNTKFSGKLCLHKKTFQSLGRSNYRCTQSSSVRQVSKFPFEDQTKVVHKVPFMLLEHVNRTKTDKTRFSFAKKRWTWYPTKQLLVNAPFQSTKSRKKELCVDNKLQETVGDVYCPTCRNEKCVFVSTNKTTTFYDCEKCKTCCHVLNIPFKDEKPTITLFGFDGTHCFARKLSQDYEKEKPTWFLEKFLRQSQPSKFESAPKKTKMRPIIEKTYPFPFGWWLEQHMHFSNLFFQFLSTVNHSNLINLHSTYRKSRSSQSPTTESSGVSILLPTLLLLQ